MPIPQSRNPLCNPGSLPLKHYQKRNPSSSHTTTQKKAPLRKTKAKEMISNSLRDSSDDTDKKQKKPRNHHKYRL